jgi:type IV pilus assembly protein PilC
MTTTFTYKARDPQGRLVEGSLEGDDRLVIADQVRRLGFIPVSVEEQSTSALRRDITIPGLSNRIKGKDLSVFSRQFATMIGSGLSMIRALSILGDQTESKPLKAVIDSVRREVEKGESLSAAMSMHPEAFNRLYISMVSAGEAAGVLDDVLDRLATILEKQVELRRKITSALTYPIAVLGLVVLVVVAMLLFVVPTFEGMYSDVGGKLPFPTRILLGLSDLVSKGAPFLLVLGIAGVVATRKWFKTDGGRTFRDTAVLKIPIIGGLMQKTAMTRFARTLSVLMRSGVPVLDSFQITSETVNNAVVSRAVLDAQAAVQRGEGMHGPLKFHPVFPPMVVQMLAVGEETGAVDTLLDKVGDFYEQEVEATVAGLTSLLEPVMIAVLGSVVGGMVVALYLPMFNLINLVQ